MEEMYVAFKAHDMYETFVSELKTALTNICGINKKMCLSSTMADAPYFKGKIDAFDEILERIEKEYTLAKNKYRPDEDNAKFIHFHKNLQANKLITDDQVRADRRKMMERGKLADTIEDAMYTAFCIGKQAGIQENKGER